MYLPTYLPTHLLPTHLPTIISGILLQYTVKDLKDELLPRIENKDHPMIIKHNKKDITDSDTNLEEVLGLQAGAGTISLILEQVERRGGVSRGWTLHIKTLTGRIFDVEISNPQVCVYVCV